LKETTSFKKTQRNNELIEEGSIKEKDGGNNSNSGIL
jgi:hypothetical protein